jgi:hypothetical protein
MRGFTMIRFAWIVLIALSLALPSLAERKSPFAFGKLSLNQGSAKVLRALGPPAEKGEIEEEMATGEMVQRWSYPKLGLEIDMSQSEGSKGFTVYRIMAEAPCDMRGYRGVNIGAFAVEINALARELENSKDVEVSRSGDEGFGFLWTEEYQMLSLTLKGGKVSEIYLGPGPE